MSLGRVGNLARIATAKVVGRIVIGTLFMLAALSVSRSGSPSCSSKAASLGGLCKVRVSLTA